MGRFRANAEGVVPDALLRLNPDVERDVADAILAPIDVPEDSPAGPAAERFPRSARREAALFALGAPPAPRTKIAVLGERFVQSIGVSLPIMAAARHLTATAQAEVRLIDVMEYHSVEAVLAEPRPDEVVLINSLRPFWVKPWLPDLVTALRGRGRTPFVYAHETRAVVEREHAAFRSAHRAMLEALEGCAVLCVSESQARMFAEMGAPTTRVVYNTSPGIVPAAITPRRRGERAQVVMVGSVQARKGADWFSRVADLAAERRLPLDFVWVGGGTPDIYQSPAVAWKGHLPRRSAEAIVRASDVFLLSSVDDPMPLSALEAIAAGVRIVAYTGVGSDEVLAGVRGYASYDRHDPEEMLAAVEAVLTQEVDAAEYQAIVDTFSVEAFSERLLAVVAADAAAASGARDAARPAGGGPVPVRDVARALRAERLDEARILTRQVVRAHPHEATLRSLATAWLGVGEREYALALLRTAYLVSDNEDEFRAAVDVTFAKYGVSMRHVDRWSMRNATRRAWRRVRPYAPGSRG
ncbi:glycosyltransferase family 4 protein [Demequina litorisediminis]|uniref:Glycosyl transferases group 1 n=1 Tax=Demequina litorisediminis TaxID=1849022 RepID=A0ABQ6IFE3_9MICO|nr:glycosyltransferase family 4 protein [Demequina litorisediminis]GMA35848.1 hypothetical protein GCM10025876_20520 [Demequina litorisediminis]